MGFWVYKDDKDNFVRIKNNSLYQLKLSKTKNINNASYFTKKKNGLSWESYILKNYPNMKLTECELTIKK